MRLAHGDGGRDDPPLPPSTGTPITELVPAPHSCRLKGVDRGTSTMVDDVFDIKGAVVVPSTLCCFETERPHLADETALERPTVTAATTETGRARVSTETELGRSHIGAETELGRSHVAAADTTELGRFHVAAGTDLHRTRVAYIELSQKLADSKITELTEDDNHDSPTKPGKRTRMHHIERHRSCVVTLSDLELNGLQPHRLQQTIEISKIPGGGSQCSLHEETPTDTNASHRHAIADAAWEALKRSIVYFRGQPIGTSAAIDKSQGAALNYDQGIYGYRPPTDIELNGLQPRRLLQTIEIRKSPGGGSQCSLHEETPTDTNASHKHAIAESAFEALKRLIVYLRGQLNGTVAAIDRSQGAALNYDQVFMRNFIPSALAFLMKETARLQSRKNMVDLGETAIGRVAPEDSGLWWITLLHAYTKWTGDNSLAESPNSQMAMHLILRLCLSEGCDTSPALLCADGCSMIDRRMDIYGYHIEIQALFFMAIRCALSLLIQDSDPDFVNHITKRIQALIYHIHSFYRYKNEEYSQIALKKFYVIPESIPDWIFDFMPSRGGYFIGNVSPARMDFRRFCLGNFIAILSSLATREQAEAILDLVEERQQELIGEMPFEICYPAMENQEWHIVTGCNPKNTRWNYHNRGSWPGIKPGHPYLARRAAELMERRMSTFSKGGDIDSCSMINQIVTKSRIPINDRGSRNCYIVSLDGSDEEILQSYMGAIESIREFCYSNTKPVDLSSIYGSKIEVFTTPEGGTFFLGFEYKNRFLVLSLAGRDLYTMGWRSMHGTFELKSDTQEENYMVADPCTVLDIPKQYMFLSPKGKVGNIRIGELAMKDAFEMLHTCRGQVSYEVMQGIGIFSVNFQEAARFQGVFNDICASFCPLDGYDVTTLDSRKTNSFWVQNWDHYAFQGMKRVSRLLNGKSPSPIDNPEGAVIEVSSESEIFKQIRILPRDAYGEWPFEHEARSSPIFECVLDSDPSGTKVREQKGTDRKKDGSKEGGDGGGGDDGGSPSSSLLDEWGLDEEGEIGEEQDNICDYFDQFTEMRRAYWWEFSGRLIDRHALPVRDWLPSYAKMRRSLKERTCCAQAQQIKPHTPWRGPVQRTVGRGMSKVCSLVTRFFRFI